MGEDDCWKARKLLQKNGVPAFTTPEEAVSTFMYMCNYAKNLELLYETPEELTIEISIPESLREILQKVDKEGRNVLTDPESRKFLQAYGIPTLTSKVAKSQKDAKKASAEIGYPVVMKALSPQIIHKSRVNGVVLDIRTATEVEESYAKLQKRVSELRPPANFNGVIIQPMVNQKGYEFLLGSKKDPQFGSVIVFGMGGVAAEMLKEESILTGMPEWKSLGNSAINIVAVVGITTIA